MHETMTQVLDRAASRGGRADALRHKRDGAWRHVSWNEYRAECRRLAKALIAAGVQRGEGVSIIGYNCPEWVYADIGAILAGAIPAGIYTTSSPEQCAYITSHCEARVSFAENAEHAKKLVSVKDKLPKLEYIVQMIGAPEDPRVTSWEDFLRRGGDVSDAVLEARIAEQKPDDVCTLIYTSGTTGEPKGVMLSHANLTWTAKAALELVGVQAGHVGVSYLPLSHIAEQLLTIHVPMAAGATIVFSESIDKIGEALQVARPHFFVGVPRVWEKIQAKMVAAGASAPALRKRIVRWARKTGLRAGYAAQRGARAPLLYPLADKLVFSKARERLGLDRARICVSSTAPIAKDTLEFFLSLGIPIIEIYGMSECTGPATAQTPARYRTGWVGWALPGTELKIAEDGEICMRGPHVFLGYYKNEAATREALDADGWLRSGDVGELDHEGFLRITDRKKELIITAGGENIAPQLVEGMLKSVPVIAQAVALGDRQRFIGALVTLDPERVVAEAELAGSPARTPAEAATCPTFRAHLEKQIEKTNQSLARVQRVRKFLILPHELTIEGGELTPSMKLKRRVIAEKYAKEIEDLFR